MGRVLQDEVEYERGDCGEDLSIMGGKREEGMPIMDA